MERLLQFCEKFNPEGNNEDTLKSKAFAEYLDSNDELSHFREKFNFPKVSDDPDAKEYYYFCGNSLGLQPKTTSDEVNREIKKWARYGVEGHWKGELPWVTIDDDVNEQMTQIVGAKSGEVAIMNTLTSNLNLLLISFYRPTKERYKILVEGKAFPSDRYAVESQVQLHSYTKEEAVIELDPRPYEYHLRLEDILEVIEREGDKIALVMLCGVHYYTGQFFDIPTITEAAHKKGCRVGFDLAHTVGNLPLKLHDWNVDFAVWCNYKYMNSGPGAIGGLFVHGAISGIPQNDNDPNVKSTIPRLQGWWGSNLDSRFTMTEPFDVLPGAYGFRQSNPNTLALAAVRPSVKIFLEAGMDRLRQKSILLTSYMEYLVKEMKDDRVVIITPSNVNERGCQLSVLFQGMNAVTISEKLIERGIIVDERKPNVIRLAPTPLYNSFVDVYMMVTALKEVLSSIQ